jgi:hypothetical protein
VAHVREELGLHLVGAAEVVGALVELRVQRDHAAVRVFELAVERDELLLPLGQLLERAQQLLVLRLDLVDRVVRALAGDRVGQHRQPIGVDDARSARQELADRHGRAVRIRRDLEPVHQPPGAGEPEPHARRRAVASLEHRGDVPDARPPIVHLDHEELRRRRALQPEDDLPAVRVAKCVARDLGDRGRDARLVLRVELEQRGDLARALARQHDVGLVPEPDREQRVRHAAALRSTTADASSVRRAKSR